MAKNPYRDLPRLFELVERLPLESRYALLRELVGNRVTEVLFQRIIELSPDEVRRLLARFEDIRERGDRTHDRKEVAVSVDYAAGDRAYRDFIRDISAAGVFIETRRSLDVGQEISLTFSLDADKKDVKVIGRVVRKTDQGVGIRFERITPYHQDIINGMLEDV